MPQRDRHRHKERTPAQQIAEDASTLVRVGGRLQARLHAQPLCALGAPAQQLIGEGLAGLMSVLGALRDTLLRVMEESHVSMDDPRRA